MWKLINYCSAASNSLTLLADSMCKDTESWKKWFLEEEPNKAIMPKPFNNLRSF